MKKNIYLREEKYLFTWRKIFIYVKKNISFHENNLEIVVIWKKKTVVAVWKTLLKIV